MEGRDYQSALDAYSEAVGVALEARPTERRDRRERPWVVLSDPHLPGLRTDLLGQIIAARGGRRANCFVAGDVLNFDRFSRWPQTDIHEPSLPTLLRERDAFLATLREAFCRVVVLGGNHDARLWKKAASLGPDYHWLTQQFFVTMFAKVHGVEFIWKPFTKRSGKVLHTCFWEQIGDCVIGHVERSGTTPLRGARLANEFFQKWRKELPLRSWPYRVLLQAHTHRRGYWFDPVSHVHCYETGALCDTPDYAVLDHRSDPIQHGYYWLVQKDGATDLNRSQLMVFEAERRTTDDPKRI